jgi:hypothetical protein
MRRVARMTAFTMSSAGSGERVPDCFHGQSSTREIAVNKGPTTGIRFLNIRETTHMDSNHSSGPTSRSASALDPQSLEAAAKSAAKDMGFEHVRHDEDLNKLRRDVASLTDTITYLASEVSDRAAKTVRNMSQRMASQVGSAASGVADNLSLPPQPGTTRRPSRPSSRAWRGAIR